MRESSALETQVFKAGSLYSANGGESKDLGFGSEVAERTKRRLLNRDGSFNVRREGYNLIQSRSYYHFLVNLSWPRFLGYVVGAYLSVNFVFAILYFLLGSEALHGYTAANDWQRFGQCFFFSVQTLATIGYGQISPQSLLANLLVVMQAFIGLMGVALATGLFFTRFARPSARLLFSKFAIIAPLREGNSFQFRLANERKNQIFQVEARVVMSRLERDGSALKRRFHELVLERSKVMFLPLHWTIVHPITPESPLFGLNEQQLAASDAEFFVLLAGIDDTFSQTVHSWSSYRYDEIIWGARFTDILEELKDGTVRINLHRLHDFDLCALPK
jgi:inward rectifier potassium channel